MLGTRYADALALAVRLHDGQVRKGTGIPYVAHVLAVSALTLEHGADEDVAIAAVLHDAVEDCGGALTGELIGARFGARVAQIVAGCTDAVVTPKPPWAQRKATYLEHLPQADADVLLVSACDKLHNARAILHDLQALGDDLWPRFQGGKRGSLWYYRSLIEAYRRTGKVPPGLFTQLEATVAAMEAAAGFSAEPHPAPPPSP